MQRKKGRHYTIGKGERDKKGGDFDVYKTVEKKYGARQTSNQEYNKKEGGGRKRESVFL